MSFPFGFQLALRIVFSYLSHQWEALIAFRFIMSGAPAWTHNLFPPNSISRLASLPGGWRHAEIWKVLNNLLVEGTGEGKVGGGWRRERGSKKWGMGVKRNRIQNCSYTALCLALLPFPSHTHILVCELPSKIQTTPQAAPAFFFYVFSSILQVFFFNGS